MWILEQWHQQTPLISAFVFCVLNKALIRLKREPPLGFWVRSHHCLCHHLLWLPNLCSRNQGSQTSTETNTMEKGLFWDFAQAATASTHLIEHKVGSTTSAQRARGAQRMARQLWGDTLSSQRHESWQSLMPTVTSAQTVEYASLLSC